MNLKNVRLSLLLLLVGCAGKAPAPVAKPVEKAAPAPTTAVQPEAQPQATATPVVIDEKTAPTIVIQQYTEELKKIVDLSPSKDKNSVDAKREHRIAEKVRQFFDFEGLARMSLSDHWFRATPAQRKEYLDLFISLVEDSYLRKTRDLVGDYQIKYEKEDIKGSESKVFCRVIRSDADVDIRYDLHRNPKNWMIYNIDLDGVDLIRNYQSQFNHIIQQSSIAGLITKLRKKWDEVSKGEGIE